jgi:hypothetical protein
VNDGRNAQASLADKKPLEHIGGLYAGGRAKYQRASHARDLANTVGKRLPDLCSRQAMAILEQIVRPTGIELDKLFVQRHLPEQVSNPFRNRDNDIAMRH